MTDVEPSPEEILSRLVRYRDALGTDTVEPVRTATVTPLPAPVAPRPVAPRPVAVAPADPASRFTTDPSVHHAALNAVEATLFGQVLATIAGALGILLFERFATNVAVIAVAAMTAIGVAAASRRVPLSLWWTTGAVIGGMLGRWS